MSDIAQLQKVFQTLESAGDILASGISELGKMELCPSAGALCESMLELLCEIERITDHCFDDYTDEDGEEVSEWESG